MPAMAEAACSYDLDQVDDAWLNILNGERVMMGLQSVTEEQFERVIEELEVSDRHHSDQLLECQSISMTFCDNNFLVLFISSNSSDVGTRYKPS